MQIRTKDLTAATCAALITLFACGDGRGSDRSTAGTSWTSGGGSGDPGSSDGSGASDGAGESSTGDGDGDGAGETSTGDSASGGGDGDVRFDVGGGEESGGGNEGGSGTGCEKVDFLFVIDNSGSMEDEQANLVAAFPAFIDTIQGTLRAQDYHIMVVDTDTLPDGGNCNGSPPSCCNSYCAADPLKLCGGTVCPGVDGCQTELGAGRVEDPATVDCGVAGGKRYIEDGQPNLTQTFQCMAQVGTAGDGSELPMAAMSGAIGTLNQPGRCNEGFVRDDAILVVTIITDEEDDPIDDPGSPGDPQDWYDAVVAAKGGNPNAVVVLGLIGDTGTPGALCQPLVDIEGAEPSPRLIEFVEMFTRGSWGSVCSPDYDAFFQAAVSSIDTACDDFVPPG